MKNWIITWYNGIEKESIKLEAETVAKALQEFSGSSNSILSIVSF